MPLDQTVPFAPLGVAAEVAPKRRDPNKLMSTDTLRVLIREELSTAIGAENGRLSNERLALMRYYYGEEFADPPPGQNRSKVVMLTVLETVEWVLPALLRIFTSSDKIADIAPIHAPIQQPMAPGMPPPMDAEQQASQATLYVDQIFNRDNPGFLILHDWFKDALLMKVGWVKRWWETEEKRETNSFTGLSEQEYQAKLVDPEGEVEVLEEKSYPAPRPEGITEDAPNFGSPMLYDCKLRVTRKQGRIKIQNVPPEEVLFTRRAKRDYIPFLQHRRLRTMTELLNDGYDEDCLMDVGQTDIDDYNPERLERYRPDDDFPYSQDRTDPPMRQFWVEESYIHADYDGDGKAELLKVVSVNRAATILKRNGKPDIEEIDEVPLVHITPVPMPHKLVGLAVADLVLDLQRIKSTLMRQMLDNIYLTNNPRHIVAETAATDETYDDLLTSKPGGIVRARTVDGVQPLVTPFVAEKAMGLVEYVDQTAEVRTGISRHNQGLDPDALNKTATGVNLIQQAAAQRVELIARIFAFGVAELVKGILGLIRKHQQQERIIRVTGMPLKLDPAQWCNEMEVSVNVGLGTGNRDQILGHLMNILQVQNQILTLQQGIDGPLVYAPDVYRCVTKLTENAGFKEKFFHDPMQPPPMPPQPPKQDPMAQAQQAQAQAELQIMQQKAAMEGQLSQQKSQQQAQLAQAKAANDQSLDNSKAQNEMTLAKQKLDNDYAMEQLRANNDMEIARIKAAHQHTVEMHKATLAAQVAAQQPQASP